MTTPIVLQFMQKTAVDKGLQQQLAELLGVGDGNISDQSALDKEEAAALKSDLAPAVVEFATSQGFNFSVKDLATTVDAFAQYQAGEISAQEFASLVGLDTQEQGSIQQVIELIYRGARYQKIDGQLVRQGLPVTFKFMQKTATDERLQKQLADLLGVGDGNISDQSEIDTEEAAALKGDLAPTVVEFAAKQGFKFSVKDLATTVDTFARFQAGELSAQEFANLVGLPVQDQGLIQKAIEFIYRGMNYQRIDGQLVRQGLPVAFKFMQKTAADEQLQRQLATLLGVGDGNISDQSQLDPEEAAALKGNLAPSVVKFAANQGFKFSTKDLTTIVDAFAQYQAGKISAQDFSSLVGLSTQEQGAAPKTIELIYRGMNY